MLGVGDGLLGEQSIGALGVRPRLVGLGDPRFPVVFGGVDFVLARAGFEFGELGGGLIAFGAQFGGVEFDNRLAGLQGVSLGGEDLLHSAAVTRGGADLVGLNRAGDTADARGIIRGATPDQESYRDYRSEEHTSELQSLRHL